MNHRFGVTVAIISGVLGAAKLFGAEPAKSDYPDSVAAEDLLSRVKIIGKLGRPLGEIVQLKGYWTSDGVHKDNELRLKITEINGKPIEKAALFRRSQVEGWGVAKETRPAIGVVWQVRALETGGIVGLPGEVYDVPVQQPYAFAFLTKLFVITKAANDP